MINIFKFRYVMPPAFTMKTSEHISKSNLKDQTEETLEKPNSDEKQEFKCQKHHFDKNNSTVSHRNKNMTFSFGRRHGRFKPYHDNTCNKKASTNLEKKKNAEKFRYGNYHQYYGYRNQGTMDMRLTCMRQEFFAGKDVLDIGCNAGHFTLSIARDFSPSTIIGMDIDYELVNMAMKNVRHYITPQDIAQHDDTFPISFVYSYGPIAQSADPRMNYPVGKFPFNVQFVQGNYILPSDELVEQQEAKYDTILCLSLTKWIHLNWGDEGIKRLFHRIYLNLRPGGFLLLEAQGWESYAKKKRITEEVYRHFSNIKFYPKMFNEYLLKEVGFTSCELLDVPAHSSKGFSRPIYLFSKAENLDVHQKQPVAKHVIFDDVYDNNNKDSDVEELSD